MFNKIYEKIKKFIREEYKLLLGIVFIIFIFNFELPYVIFRSGGIIDLSSRVEIDKNYESEGTLNMSYVTTMKGTIPFLLVSLVLPDWDIYSVDEVTGGMDYKENFENAKYYLKEGIDNAIIAAFRESDYDITLNDSSYVVNYIYKEANTDLKVGDKITKVNESSFDGVESLKELIASLKVGDKLNLTVNHEDKEYQRFAKIIDYEGNNMIGIMFNKVYDYETEVPVKINMKKNESGSSGGLMMSLSVYNALTDDDITHGLKIVGTGSITSDGVVEEIGGIKYKLIGASKKNADIFFCPKENYEEALKVKNERNLDIDLVMVETLKDAINYLKNI